VVASPIKSSDFSASIPAPIASTFGGTLSRSTASTYASMLIRAPRSATRERLTFSAATKSGSRSRIAQTVCPLTANARAICRMLSPSAKARTIARYLASF
jgi:hypothetical protein